VLIHLLRKVRRLERELVSRESPFVDERLGLDLVPLHLGSIVASRTLTSTMVRRYYGSRIADFGITVEVVF
jgi:hypothetical protein